MEAIIMENSNLMRFQEEVNTFGQMESSMMVNGRIIKCMDMEF